jgi:hypothetical protein
MRSAETDGGKGGEFVEGGSDRYVTEGVQCSLFMPQSINVSV